MTNLESIKSKVSQAEDFARKIWLAGLGAYAKSYDEVQGKAGELSAEAGKVFDELVAKGETVESETKDKFKEKADDLKVNERVAEIREKLGMNTKGTSEKIDELSAKIDSLADTVAKLADK